MKNAISIHSAGWLVSWNGSMTELEGVFHLSLAPSLSSVPAGICCPGAP
jgi:hypothetical protein